ncbi:hypothetical protein BofuT4_uP052830.1 [Botrytis cinerea T4]|uniref:Uncharacterized protein n=1 Tax=Botryotinia fuckeliana (strain T4) TaxID=999810 RepID=G2XWR4_BOTF4|nr:hypothetical protein BofuT4_uP052830.1 [Botrytis cinerea T4]
MYMAHTYGTYPVHVWMAQRHGFVHYHENIENIRQSSELGGQLQERVTQFVLSLVQPVPDLLLSS